MRHVKAFKRTIHGVRHIHNGMQISPGITAISRTSPLPQTEIVTIEE